MRKNLWGIIILSILVGSMIFCGACAIGLNKPATKKIEEVQAQLNELNRNFENIRQEIQTLNNNLDELKGAITRLADVLESINKRLGITLTIKNLIP